MREEAPVHGVIVCTRCQAVDGSVPGPRLIERLEARLDTAPTPWTVRGAACLAGCERPLAVAFRAPAKAAFLFGSILPEDCEALLEFAALYATLSDGWCNEGERPRGLRGKTLARIPALPGGAP